MKTIFHNIENKTEYSYVNLKLNGRIWVVIFVILTLISFAYVSFRIVSPSCCTSTTCTNGFKWRTLPFIGKTCTTCT